MSSDSAAPEEVRRAVIELALLCAKHRYQLDLVPAGRLRDLQTTLASVLRARDIQLDLIEQQRGLISKQNYELSELRRWKKNVENQSLCRFCQMENCECDEY